METRPLSKLKRWRIVRIVRQGAQQALAGEGEAAVEAQRLSPDARLESRPIPSVPTSVRAHASEHGLHRERVP